MIINPVLLKELKVKMRSWKAVGIIGGYLFILAAVALFITYANANDMYASTINPQFSIGAYTGIAVIQFILILFIAPALTAGSIAGERERQTLDLILCTKLAPRSIVIGKLLASMSHILILIIASLPMFSIVFLYGGISVIEIAQLFGFYIVTAIMAGSVGIFFSTYVKRTIAATVLTYALGIFMCFGTLFVAVFYIRIFYNYDYQSYFPLFYINPLAGFSSLLAEQFGGQYGNILNMIPGLHMVNSYAMKGPSPWLINTYVNIGISIVMLFLAAIKINPARRSIFSFLKRTKKAV
jgi:ABC-type transport system involved in multi-copper enzyme maturation permease subunit